MLPLWADRVYVAIAIDRIAILHISGFPFKRHVVLEKTIDLSPLTNDSNLADSIAVQLAVVLKSLNIKQGNLEVLLSSQFVHLAMIQGFPNALSPLEQQRVMQVNFERIYGDRAKKWHFRTQRFTYNQPALAAAIDQSLIAAFEKVSRESGLKLISVEPAFAPLFNHWQKHLSKQTVWFVAAERNYITISTVQEHRFVSVAQMPLVDTFSSDELFTSVRREALKQGKPFEGLNLLLFAPHIPSGGEPSKLNVQRLRLPITGVAKVDNEYHLMNLISQL